MQDSKGKGNVRDAALDVWVIAALWRYLAKDLLHDRHWATSLCAPLAHSCVGNAISLDFVVSDPNQQFISQGMELLGEDNGPGKVM